MDLGMVGLGKMGGNMSERLVKDGHRVVGYARSPDEVRSMMKKGVDGAFSLEEVIQKLSPPRVIWLMIPAGAPVDQTIKLLIPQLEKGDIIIDGGNSNYKDTIKRAEMLKENEIHYVDVGTSGGIWGLKEGYSMMIGGEKEAVESLRPIFETLAPSADKGWGHVGPNGAGHFVKMVHNGIEYGDMQMICETYQMMKQGLGMSNHQMHEVFAEWNNGELDSYLIEITRDILGYKDEDGNEVVDLILDTAGQKGTGKWAGITALNLGQPLTLIGEAVFARCLSALKDERVEASKVLTGPKAEFKGDKNAFITDLRQALYASKIVSYAQGYQLMRAAAREYNWSLNNGGIALMWRGGCIIRSVFLGKIKDAFDKNPDLVNLLLAPFFREAVEKAQPSWRRVVTAAVEMGVPMPAMGSALAYYDGYRSERLPANLLQAHRDYFGAHTYERVDRPRGEFFHTNWTGHGGETAASTYTA